MKKSIIIVLIFIIILAVVILINNTLKIIGFGLAVSEHAPKMNKEELNLCLNQNREQFVNVANIFITHPSILEIAGYNKFGSGNKDKYYYTTKNKLFIESKDKLDNETINEINDSSIKSIFEKLKFESILQMENCIYFIEGGHLGYAHGIVYSSIKEKPEYKYIIELEKIEDKWFYFRLR